MNVSEARLQANRKNAAKSSGPKTVEGKARSRGNALKHGLTGEGVALSSEDAALIEQRFVGFEADFHPVTEAGIVLVRRAAMLSIRLERCVEHEAAALSSRIRSAETDFDEARLAEVDFLIATIGEDPAYSVRRLLQMPEGVDRMLVAWNDLRDDLTVGDGSRWGAEHGAMALHLIGRPVGGFGVARVEALFRAIRGDFTLLSDEDGQGLDPRARRQWSRESLVTWIGSEITKLEAHRATIDRERVEQDRAGAAKRALFDPSKAATLARKYEAAAEREMYRALKAMKAVEAETTEPPATAPIPSPSPEVGSFLPETLTRSVSPEPSPSAVPLSSRSGDREGSSFVPKAIGRSRVGSA